MKNRELLKKNKVYNAVIHQMLAYERAYLCGIGFKQTVRRKRPSEDSVLYLDLIANTVTLPICRYIVDTINDVLFEPGVKRNLLFVQPDGTFIEPSNTEWADLFLLDADLNNRSLDSFMEQVGDLTSIFGHCWIAVDMPKENQGSLGRPYCVAITPPNVWDWDFDYYGGRPILKFVKVCEFEDDECYYIKCYHLGTGDVPSSWRQWEVRKTQAGTQAEQEATLLDEGFFPPGMGIPLFIAYGRQDPRTIELGVSDIDAASDAQREHYKLECEAYSSIQFAKTIIRANKGVAIPVHAGAIVRAQKDDIEAIKVDTTDVEIIQKKQNDLIEHIEALTGVGGLRNRNTQAQSGASIIQERKQLHRTAKAKARLMEVTEEMIFTFAARFMDMRWAGDVNYNTNYEAHDTNYRMALMQQAKTIEPNNEIINTLIVREMIGMLAPPESLIQFEEAFVSSITNPQIKQLMQTEATTVVSRDLASQIPPSDEVGIDEEGKPDFNSYQSDDGSIKDTNATLLGGTDTQITPSGLSLYPQQAVAVQINGLNIGR